MTAEPLRMDLSKIAPEAYHHFLRLEGLITQHVEVKLLHLLKLRASQINGCAFCIAMHTDEALRDGEPVERLTLLDAWEESTLYSDKERAALAWVEEVHSHRGQWRDERDFRESEKPFQPGGDRLADACSDGNQRLEPDGDQQPRAI